MRFPGLLALFVYTTTASAITQTELDRVLAMDQAPPGVVFEVIEEDSDSLEWVAPLLQRSVATLRDRFPKIPVAVISHGEELLGMERNVIDTQSAVYQALEQLSQSGVEIQACGSHAYLNNLFEDDFPAFVELASSASAAMDYYQALGYVHLLVEKPE